MFGLFKKPDTRESTDRSLAYINSLPPDTKADIVGKIEKFLEMVSGGVIAQADAFQAAMEAKQHCMYRNGLRDHRHPEFSMLQLIEDAYLSLYAHKKMSSGKYSAIQFTNFLIENTADPQRLMALLAGGGFDIVNLT